MVKQLLTASRIGSYLRCQRQHYWRYEVGLQREEASLPLRFGTVWHKAMEERSKGLEYTEALELAMACKDGATLDEYEAAKIAAMLAGYYAHYGRSGSDDTVDQLHAEIPFNLPINGSRRFDAAGVIDGLGQFEDGRLCMVEYKTAGESVAPDAKYWLRLRLNDQVFQYVWSARAVGWDIQEIVYDVAHKPGIAPKQVADLDEAGLKIVMDTNTGERVKTKKGWRQSGDKAKGYEVLTHLETADEYGDRLAKDIISRPEFYFQRKIYPVLDTDLDEFIAERLVVSRQILCNRRVQKTLDKPETAWPRTKGASTCDVMCEFEDFCLVNQSVDLTNPPSGFVVGEIHPELKEGK